MYTGNTGAGGTGWLAVLWCYPWTWQCIRWRKNILSCWTEVKIDGMRVKTKRVCVVHW